MITELTYDMPNGNVRLFKLGYASDDGIIIKIECNGSIARIWLDNNTCEVYSGYNFTWLEVDSAQPFKINPEFVHIVVNHDRSTDDCIEGVFMYPDDAENEIQSLNDQKAFPDSFSIKTVRIQRKRIKE